VHTSTGLVSTEWRWSRFPQMPLLRSEMVILGGAALPLRGTGSRGRPRGSSPPRRARALESPLRALYIYGVRRDLLMEYTRRREDVLLTSASTAVLASPGRHCPYA
jgi:hypothetical protein